MFSYTNNGVSREWMNQIVVKNLSLWFNQKNQTGDQWLCGCAYTRGVINSRVTLQRREQCWLRYMIRLAQETEEILNITTDQPQGHQLKLPYPFICSPSMRLVRK
ncbi:Uncharacterized protein Rs2_10983 [Raphanus sativus]|nr:Uncharacterized protein Rs2_10983 [Raphanus sativus]